MKFAKKIFEFRSVPSTNQKAFELLKTQHLPHGSLVWAHQQTAGRGTGQNTWESQPGKNFTFSLVLRPTFLPAHQQFYLSKAISLGIVDYLQKKNTEAQIKWPNDIYAGNRKIAGILIENQLAGSEISVSVVGIGLNINQTRFAQAPNAVSLAQLTNRRYVLPHEKEILLQSLDNACQQLSQNNFRQTDRAYHWHLLRKERWAKYRAQGKLFEGKILGVSPPGNLLVEIGTGEKIAFDFKEIEFVFEPA